MIVRRLSFFVYVIALIFFYQGNTLGQFSLIDSLFTTSNIDDTLTKGIDYTSVPGKFQLSTGEVTNLAAEGTAYIVYAGALPTDTAYQKASKLLDGILGTYCSFPGTGGFGGALGSYIVVDLAATRSVNRIRVLALASQTIIKAYTIYGGADTLSMTKLWVEKDESNFQATPKFYTEISFPTVNVRYLKITIDELRANNTLISDFQVFGPGYLPRGTIYSKVKTLPRAVNFSSVEYKGEKPNLGGVFFSLRSGSSPTIDTTWGPWSEEVAGNKDLFEVYEPRKYIQYKVRLTTDTLTSPVIDEIKINYDTSLVVTGTRAEITPQNANVLKEQTFTLSITLSFKQFDLGVDKLHFLTPSPVTISGVYLNGSPIAFSKVVTFKDADIIFSNTLKTSGTLDIVFKTTPFIDVKPHTVTLISNALPGNPQRADAETRNGVEAWSLILTGVPTKLINELRIVKNPFTPNGDGINDFTTFEFFLGNLSEPRSILGTQTRNLSVKIFDLTGRLIRDVYNELTSAAAYKGEGNPMIWDGKDYAGKVVRPGVYLVQFSINADSGTEQITKTVVVAY